MRARGWVLGLAAVALLACAPRPAGSRPADLDAAQVRAQLTHLTTAIGPRPDGSAASQQAAAYLEAELRAMGAVVERVPVGDLVRPAVVVAGRTILPARPTRSPDDNLVVRFGASAQPALLLMAHYDSVDEAPGANDNAAAVAVLLELARALLATPPPRPVLLAFTAAEEVGLLGARRLAERVAAGTLPPVDLAIALDAVGTDGPLIVNGASELVREPELRWLARAAERADVELEVPAPYRVVSRLVPQIERADHGAFTERGIRAVHLYRRGHGDDPFDRAYHSHLDRLERVSPRALAELGRLLRGLIDEPRPPPSGADGDRGLWLPLGRNRVAPLWTLRLVLLLLGALAIVGLLWRRAPLARPAPGTRGWGVPHAVVVYLLAGVLTWGGERVWPGGYPGAWAHAPLRAMVALGVVQLVVAGAVGLLLAQARPWLGRDRYVAVAVGWLLVVTAALVGARADELAWPTALAAAALAGARHVGRFAWVLLAVGAVAALLPLSPSVHRELVFHRMYPLGLGLAPVVVVWLGPLAAALAWAARSEAAAAGARRQPRSRMVVAIAAIAVAAVVASTLVRAVPTPPCTPAAFARWSLGCELGLPARE